MLMYSIGEGMLGMATTVRFTQSVSLPGTNSYAWSSPSNWAGGALPVSGDQVVISQPVGVSYDNYQLSGALLNFRVGLPNQSPSPVLEIASGITLDAGAIFNYGTTIVDAGAELAITPTGRVADNNLTEVAGTLGIQNFLNTGTYEFEGPSADIYLNAAKAVWNDIATNDVENFGLGDGLFLKAYVLTIAYPTYTANLSGTTLTVDGIASNGTSRLLYELPNFDVAAGVTGVSATVVTATNPVTDITNRFLEISAVCFLAGTRIATEHGEIAVEELCEGDWVLTAGSGGRSLRQIRWIGERRLDLTAHPRPESLFPIRIRRDALAEQMPQRDLLVSPDHCLFLDGVLIPAKLLVNGMTIVQDRAVPVVHYYHVELDNHDVLLAEGVAAESYLDTGNRGFFVNTDGALTLHPELEIDAERLRWQDRLCAPLCLRSVEIEPTWQRLAARAETLGYRRPSPKIIADPDLCLAAQGRRFRPVAVDGNSYLFVLPAGVSDIRITSRSGMPVVAKRHSDDWRRLGVAIGRISVRIGDERIDIPADHPSLVHGWHPAERDSGGLRRWTDGNAALPLALSKRNEAVTVEVHLAGSTPYTLQEETAANLAA
jgi:hypothetical protein